MIKKAGRRNKKRKNTPDHDKKEKFVNLVYF